jgi:hypothetical protein
MGTPIIGLREAAEGMAEAADGMAAIGGPKEAAEGGPDSGIFCAVGGPGYDHIFAPAPIGGTGGAIGGPMLWSEPTVVGALIGPSVGGHMDGQRTPNGWPLG